MKEVVIRVAPMTRQVLLSEHGAAEPIIIGQNELTFQFLTSAPLREFGNVSRSMPFLTSTITILVHNDVAAWLFARPYHAGALLFRLHKDQMCRYAHARVRGKADAWASLQEWLSQYGIEEDAYGMEAAYKCWQRFLLKKQQKNPVFFSRFRPKKGEKAAKKPAPKMTMPATEIEQALDIFLSSVHRTLRRTPARFPRHARAWFYRQVGGLSEREAARLLGMHRASIGYGCRSMQNWIDTNPKIKAIVRQSTGLLAA